MCSTTRGPAIWPSLVTWPTRTMAGPPSLASRTSSAAQARTWVTEPGPASWASDHRVWMESMMTMSNLSRFSVVRISRRAVAEASDTAASATPMRLARARICSMASSPEI